MSWKSLVTASVLCIVASPAWAAPTLRVSGSINNKNATPVRVWNVAIAPDTTLDPDTAIALELGLQATGGNILSVTATPNMSAAAAPAPARVDFDTNPGNVIFGWEALTDVDPGPGTNMKPVGIQIGSGANANQAVAFLGTNIFNTSNRYDLLTITTQSSVTSLAFGGAYNTSGALLTPNGSLQGVARIAQGNTTSAVNFHEASYGGSLASLGPTTLRFLADMDGSGSVNSFDIAAFSQALNTPNTYKTNRPHLNILRADINGSGTINSFDIAPFSQVLNNVGITGAGSGLELAAVPEPASVMFVGMILACGAMIRRRTR